MIDAHAVWNHLQRLSGTASDEQRAAEFESYLADLQLRYGRDGNGDYLVTLPGTSERTVLLGCHLARGPQDGALETQLDLVTGLETMRALSHRFAGAPPCTVALLVWKSPAAQGAEASQPNLTSLHSRLPSAYLGMQVAFTQDTAPAAPAIGVVKSSEADGPATLHPRLATLCEEAILELTGACPAVPGIPDVRETALAQTGTPVALMHVDVPNPSTDRQAAEARRLHMLQAAEAFGRWAEATVHLVAGDDVDLWAREHRTPHTAAS